MWRRFLPPPITRLLSGHQPPYLLFRRGLGSSASPPGALQVCPLRPHAWQPDHFPDMGFPLPRRPSCPAAHPSGSTPNPPSPVLPLPHSCLLSQSPHAQRQRGHSTRTNRAIKSLPPAPHFWCPLSLLKCPHSPAHALSPLSAVLFRKAHKHLPGHGCVDPLPASPFTQGTRTPFCYLHHPRLPALGGEAGGAPLVCLPRCPGQGLTPGHPWLSRWLQLGACPSLGAEQALTRRDATQESSCYVGLTAL